MAWTERYVRSDAAGGGNGTTTANSGGTGAWTLAEAITNEAAGMRLNVRAGTYASTTTSRALAAAGSETAPIWWRGCDTSFNPVADTSSSGTAGTDIPAFTFTTGQFSVTGAHHRLSNLAVSGACTSSSGQALLNAASIRSIGCRYTNTASNADARALTHGSSGSSCHFIRCYFSASTSTVDKMVRSAGANAIYHGCVFSGGTVGVALESSATFLHCVFTGQTGDCIIIPAQAVDISNCSFYGGSGHGINISSVATGVLIASCHFENFTGASKYAITNSSGANTHLVTRVSNSYYNCTGYENGFGDASPIFDRGVLGATGFTNAAGGDFSAATTLKAIGFPGPFENTSAYLGYLDNGAVQRQEPAGGGGGTSGGFLARGPASIIQMIE
jgi:hypothetical protein